MGISTKMDVFCLKINVYEESFGNTWFDFRVTPVWFLVHYVFVFCFVCNGELQLLKLKIYSSRGISTFRYRKCNWKSIEN